MDKPLMDRVRECPTLPTLPAVAVQILKLTQSEHLDVQELGRFVSKDPALCTKLLRTVNSSFYGYTQSVSTVNQALLILGFDTVKTLVLGFSLVGNLAKNKTKAFDHRTYWQRSLYAATA